MIYSRYTNEWEREREKRKYNIYNEIIFERRTDNYFIANNNNNK